MTRYACPICGDPSGYPIWIDPEPPTACPNDPAWGEDGLGDRTPTVKSVAECPFQRRKAEQAARWRRICPEAFDSHGNMVKGGLAMVLQREAETHLAAGTRPPEVIL